MCQDTLALTGPRYRLVLRDEAVHRLRGEYGVADPDSPVHDLGLAVSETFITWAWILLSNTNRAGWTALPNYQSAFDAPPR